MGDSTYSQVKPLSSERNRPVSEAGVDAVPVVGVDGQRADVALARHRVADTAPGFATVWADGQAASDGAYADSVVPDIITS